MLHEVDVREELPAEKVVFAGQLELVLLGGLRDQRSDLDVQRVLGLRRGAQHEMQVRERDRQRGAEALHVVVSDVHGDGAGFVPDDDLLALVELDGAFADLRWVSGGYIRGSSHLG